MQEELNTGDASEPLIITVTSDWEVKQTSSLITGALDATLRFWGMYLSR